jgi:IS30 family transposase
MLLTSPSLRSLITEEEIQTVKEKLNNRPRNAFGFIPNQVCCAITSLIAQVK